MIELSFDDFHEQNYEEKGFCLYVLKNGLGDVLYIGISTVSVWSRWFGWGGNMMWDGKVIYGETSIGEKIANHLPDSLDWKIQLWTLKDCQEFCGQEIPDPKFKLTAGEYSDAVREIEPRMIKKLSPALNRHLNLSPGRDTTPRSKKEIKREKLLDKAYDEIFNKKDI